MTEIELQIAVMDMLGYALTDNAMALHIANQGKRSPRFGSELKRMGMLPGVADIVVFWEGGYAIGPRVGWIELKSEDGRASPAQENFAKRVVHIGHRYALCRSVDEVLNYLDMWHVPHKPVTLTPSGPATDTGMKIHSGLRVRGNPAKAKRRPSQRAARRLLDMYRP